MKSSKSKLRSLFFAAICIALIVVSTPARGIDDTPLKAGDTLLFSVAAFAVNVVTPVADV